MTIYTPFQPFVYLIGWSKLDRFHVGFAYGPNSHPDNLLKTIFPKNYYCRKMFDNYGKPDVSSILFLGDKESVRVFKEEYLNNLSVKDKVRFLNFAKEFDEFRLPKPTRKVLTAFYDKNDKQAAYETKKKRFSNGKRRADRRNVRKETLMQQSRPNDQKYIFVKGDTRIRV